MSRLESETVKLAPSILAADFARLGEQVDEAQKAAFERLLHPAVQVVAPPERRRFICDADRDLAVLAAALPLVRNERDGSRLADLVKCGTP